MWNNYFNVYLCHTYKWQRILNHYDIDGISYCRILLLTNTLTCTNATTFLVENRLLGNEKSGKGFALSDADTLPKQPGIFLLSASIFLIEITQRKMVRSVCLKPVSMATWRLHTLWRFTFTAYVNCSMLCPLCISLFTTGVIFAPTHGSGQRGFSIESWYQPVLQVILFKLFDWGRGGVCVCTIPLDVM